jgi:hypothetical protein
MKRTDVVGDLILRRMRSMERPRRFSPEVRERAIRLVMEQRRATPASGRAWRRVERERLVALECGNRKLKRTTRF